MTIDINFCNTVSEIIGRNLSKPEKEQLSNALALALAESVPAWTSDQILEPTQIFFQESSALITRGSHGATEEAFKIIKDKWIAEMAKIGITIKD